MINNLDTINLIEDVDKYIDWDTDFVDETDIIDQISDIKLFFQREKDKPRSLLDDNTQSLFNDEISAIEEEFLAELAFYESELSNLKEYQLEEYKRLIEDFEKSMNGFQNDMESLQKRFPNLDYLSDSEKIMKVQLFCYNELWISEDINNNSWIENFVKWLIDSIFIENFEIVDLIIDTKWEALFDIIKEILSWEWLKNMLEGIGMSIYDLFFWDMYEKWRSVWELWLIWVWSWALFAIMKKYWRTVVNSIWSNLSDINTSNFELITANWYIIKNNLIWENWIRSTWVVDSLPDGSELLDRVPLSELKVFLKHKFQGKSFDEAKEIVQQLNDHLPEWNKEVFSDICFSNSEYFCYIWPDGKLTIPDPKDISNAISHLEVIKSFDPDWTISLDVRKEMLYRYEQMTTAQVFTKYPLPTTRNAQKDFVADSNNWIPERVKFQNELLNSFYSNALNLSEALWSNPPVVVFMRWNTASWKTTALKEWVEELWDTANSIIDNPNWILNPDSIKYAIRESDIVDWKHTICDEQTYLEWSMLAKRLQERLLTEQRSLVIDKRFDDTVSVSSLIEKTPWYRRIMIDVDRDIHHSTQSVLNRDVLWEDPVVPFDHIEEWYRWIRENRYETASFEWITEYYWYRNTFDGNSWDMILVATWRKWTIDVLDEDIREDMSSINWLHIDEARSYRLQIEDKITNWRQHI